MLDTKQLKARLVLAGFTSKTFGEAMGWKASTTYRKVNAKRDFTVPEVDKAIELLSLTPTDTLSIFFNSAVSETT